MIQRNFNNSASKEKKLIHLSKLHLFWVWKQGNQICSLHTFNSSICIFCLIIPLYHVLISLLDKVHALFLIFAQSNPIRETMKEEMAQNHPMNFVAEWRLTRGSSWSKAISNRCLFFSLQLLTLVYSLTNFMMTSHISLTQRQLDYEKKQSYSHISAIAKITQELTWAREMGLLSRRQWGEPASLQICPNNFPLLWEWTFNLICTLDDVLV